ncbi:SDR family NAD(P)-dependent oxidoreductase [Actinomadura sp. ATCC 31491]|uniref:SDR family NAD(P)-dependent oxidoreductase n=1 Tax=Actinomadura luzonensis TaxID=2805427 RepID=A0ABT0FUE6_9ACTN|nr:type I polyketide synthase [Actinomadura luzonensis]MCK2215894.1 SDR family NAD(P)-dependent oxidoreductase [Actinomadura luzonensis]
MNDFTLEPIAVVGVSAIMPDAPDAAAFWANVRGGRYSISDVPVERWDPALYYDPDPKAPDKTYSRIGGWVREFPWDPLGWRLAVPPTVAAQLDDGQKWAVSASRAALLDAGWPGWHVDPERVAVVIGNALGGEKHYRTSSRIELPEYLRRLREAPSFAALPEAVRAAVLEETATSFRAGCPPVTEDTMPGELANIIAGRVANLFNFRGPNYITDAACASALAAMSGAVRGLQAHDFDAVVAGGVDRNMGVNAFVKFCKIGALSATGTRPFDAGADGFVMGEGAALFVLRRLSDAERDGDRIYAVIRALAGSSDGRGKGITAPNPVGQRLAVERAWAGAGLDPAQATLIEAHGTSTRVGDAAELSALTEVFQKAGARPGSIALGSVKSNIGHLKAAAGAAGLVKTIMSLHDGVLAPSLHVEQPNPNVDWPAIPFRVNTELREWERPAGGVRCAGVSAFGFGGTNFHAVLEEYVPGRHRPPDASRVHATAWDSTRQTASTPAPATIPATATATATVAAPAGAKAPLRGAVVVGGADEAEVIARLEQVRPTATPQPPDPALAAAPIRVAIDYADPADLADKAAKAVTALRTGNRAMWRMLRAKGVFLGRGPAPKVAFLYTGQGSQYVNMLRDLREREPIVAAAFDEADRVMAPLLERPLTSYVFTEDTEQARQALLQTEITQPAVLTVDAALTSLLDAYGVRPDMVMGHSLGEYGALVAAGSLTFAAALEAVSARGHEMASLDLADNGAMAAVFGPLPEIERIVAEAGGYVVVANINSTSQAVVGGATEAVEAVVARFQEAGLTATRIPVSHAFHTSIVAPAGEPLKAVLRRLDIRPPVKPIVANVTGRFYPPDADTATMLDVLGRQVASPVQFVTGLRTLYEAGARVFVEVGPKKALHGFAEDVLGAVHDDVLSLYTNHPKTGGVAAFNQALCGLYAAGLAFPPAPAPATAPAPAPTQAAPRTATPATLSANPLSPPRRPMTTENYAQLGRLFAQTLEQGLALYGGRAAGDGARSTEPVVVTGAALGLPGVDRVFDDDNLARILAGQQFIDAIPHRLRREMVDRHITRLVKRASGDPTFETIGSEADVLKLAGRHAPLDVVAEFGVDEARDAALDVATRLAVGAGFDALRDAGVPLVMHYKTTTLGTSLPDRWGLPEALRDETGVIFASAFPAYDAFADELKRYFTDRGRREQLLALEAVRSRMRPDEPAAPEVERRIAELRHLLDSEPYVFDRRFLFRCLSMGHSQFAEIIGARGPNTQVNAACASTTQAMCLAEDWIRAGRCRRVVVISADDATSDTLLPWMGAGFLASGAAATDDVVEDAATPFDRRRHGMIVGMGAAAIVVESAEAARERGLQPICEMLGAVTANSAYHGTRLDVEHISQVMEQVVRQAEARGADRHALASETVFVSHETYTPARGGSAAAEIHALRSAFGASAGSVVIANTKGFTGHAMGAGIEDVVAIKSVETGIVPPVPNYKEPDPELGTLNLSTGGAYPVRYALRLAAGFGSQIAMTLLRWTPVPDGRHRAPNELGHAYRIVDQGLWQSWLATLAGRPDARLEVVQRRLRFADVGAPPPRTAPTPAPAPVTVPVTVTVPAPVPVAEPEPALVAGPATPVAAPEAPAAPADDLAGVVVEIVSGMTGYPPELLEPDLDLEADLGVDTVKQAEIFAAVRERFDLERDPNLRLRDFPTLNHVIGWIRDRVGARQEPAAPLSAPLSGPPAEPAAQPPAEPQAPGDEILTTAVGIVAEMTGYPPELLEPDLDLEADLGVDTVKQAEIFAAVRERFSLERDPNLRLRDFPTLNHVIGWIRDRVGARQEPAPAEQPAPQETQAKATPAAESAPDDRAYPRRVPVPVLRPALDRCKPTGVPLSEGTRIVVGADTGGVAKALTARLAKLGCDVLTLDPAGDAGEQAARLDAWRSDGPVHGVYWLAALDEEGPAGALDLPAWREALRRRVKSLYQVLHRAYEHTPFLVAGTRLGGLHGYDDAGAAPGGVMGGAVTGFAKAYAREVPSALVKAVDFPAGRKTAATADTLIEETLRDPGCVEVGHADGLRWTIGLAEAPFPAEGEGEGGLALGPETVFLVTGAAGGIVSAITADLARASSGVFHLLDLTPEPDPDDPELRRYATDREGFKADVVVRLKQRGERPTPVLIERELAHYERLQAAQAAIEAVRNAGGTARYHCVDLTDPDAVARVVDAVRAENGRVDVLLHAAGLEISRSLADKQPKEFDLVLDVKADGWFNLLHAAGDLPIGATVVFSSVAGRFGNAGQADYSAANDLLCKASSAMRRARPGTRALALDWTAWGGIGMATRGSIPKIMELAGIEMLTPATGVPWIRRELTSSGYRGEVVVAGALGVLAAERDATGGLDPAAVPAGGVMTETAEGYGVHTGLVVRTTLDPRRQPFLDHHRIDGTAVLPGVMGVEAFAEAARLAAPGWPVVAVEDVDFLAPLKFYKDEPRTLTVRATVTRDGADLLARCALEAERTLPGAAGPQRTVHFTGTVRLSHEERKPEGHARAEEPGLTMPPADVYTLFFHGPAYRVVAAAWGRDGAGAARMADDLPPSQDPPDRPTVTPPRLVELCFQTAGLAQAARDGVLALPAHVDRIVLPAAGGAAGGLQAVVTPAGGGYDCAVLGGEGEVLVRVDGYRGVPLPGELPEPTRGSLAPLTGAPLPGTDG